MQKKLPTTTIIDYKPDLTVDIIARYEGGSSVDELPNILSSIISEVASIINGTSVKEGDLVMVIKNYPTKIQVSLDGDGNLILFVEPIENHYSVDEINCNLLYTKD